jgi:hypothetical protein
MDLLTIFPVKRRRLARRSANAPGGCKVVAMSRACGAFAIDGKNACGPHGYAVATRLGEAQNKALRQCYQFGGKDCVIRAWACDCPICVWIIYCFRRLF